MINVPVEGIKVWLITVPERIFCRVVLRVDHGAIHAAMGLLANSVQA
jgi:hypothetical protein